MKRKLVRELALISLPLLFIAGAAWLLPRAGLRKPVPAPDNGPARLEFDAFAPVELSALDVYRGVDWAVKTSVRMKGQLQVPAALKANSIGQGLSSDARIVYRVGKKWHSAAALPNNFSPISQGFDMSSGAKTLNLDLETVPAAAQEIRLRGKFTESHDYKGVWPAGVKKPANYAKVDKFHSFTIESKPFDVPVQAPGQGRPRPTASRETGVSVVKASYESDNGTGLRVQLRRDPKFGKPEKFAGAALISMRLLDGKGRELDICEAAGRPASGYSLGAANDDELQLPDSDFVNLYLFGHRRGEQPCGGWKKYHGPFTLEAVISAQQRWPVVVKVPVPASVAR